MSRLLHNFLDVLRNDPYVLRNVQVCYAISWVCCAMSRVLRNFLGVLCNDLGVLQNVLQAFRLDFIAEFV